MTTHTPDKPERPKTLGREVHEKYPASVVGDRDAYRDELTHVDEHGDVRMVDVGEKAVTQRLAIAEGSILMHPETQAMVLEDRAKKGDVLACARIAGIMASKRTSDIIPMCHPLNLTKAKVEIEPIASGARRVRGWAPAREDGRVGFRVRATCGVTGVTGIEMEALTAASAACLTIYDMCKAVDRGMEVVDVRLLRKEGGRSGVWDREAELAASLTDADGMDEAEQPVASALPGGPNTGAQAPAVAFVGYQNSGKTTLVEKVISRLTQRGVRVGSVKHHGHKGFEIDQPGKDSWRHAQAGSRHVGLISPDAYAEYARTSEEVTVTDILTRYTDVDAVIVEGYKAAGLPSIVVARSGIDRMRGRDSFDLINENTLAVACNDVVARDFRTRAMRAARAEAEEAGRVFDEESVQLPPFLDINDSAAIASFVYEYLQSLQ
ncbi:cyclic pyranopterin monophosphate synthase MoaC [Collinsella stercoris]|uniref:Cyclic pyranopterin monophosphate synthase n=1 Tax=Collinsella stercoris DSM 13279 TaxID=445975 RepID=B6G7X2_9ACTN|nr:cyclic pyranopterin monophosphate synthase MoaC [Collinsella stercoris]EEA91598.1 molybdenum cofactor biosynthesis protein C [Collinsella stercoris DSM 13279]